MSRALRATHGWLRPVLALLLSAAAAVGTAAPAQEGSEEAAPPTQEGAPDVPAGAAAEERAQDVPIVRGIRVEGLDFHPLERVLGVIEQQIGEPFDFAAERRSAQTLWRSYQILVVDSRLVPLEDGVELVLRVIEQPVDFEARFVGNAKVDTAQLLEWAGLAGEPVVYQHQIERIRARIVDGYRAKGYHFAEVDVVTTGGSATPGEARRPLDVIFQVREGPKVRVTRVEVRGNENIPITGMWFWKGGLRELADARIRGRGPLSWWGKVFVEEELEGDLVAMREVYRARGWLDAVVQLDRLEFDEDRDRVVVHLLVDEGPLYRIASVDVQAVEPDAEDSGGWVPAELYFPEEELLGRLAMVAGEPFEQGRLEADRRALRDFYGERGYLEARYFQESWDERGRPRRPDAWEFLEPTTVIDYERKEVELVYRLHQGRQRYVEDVRFRGNLHTRDKVLRREVSVLPGELANIREIERSRARLTGTGFFTSQNDPLHPPPYFVLRETADPERVLVEYVVEEGSVVDLQVSGGVGSETGVIGTLALRMHNFDAGDFPASVWSTFGEIYRKEAFHGNGETLLLEVAPGSEINSGRVRYRHPDVFGTHFDRWSLAGEASLQDRAYRSHDQLRERYSLELGRQLGFDTAIEFGPVYQQLEIDDLDAEDEEATNLPSTLVDSAGESDFIGLRMQLVHSVLDNRISPRSGSYTLWQTTAYGGILGGDHDFVKMELYHDRYFELGDEDDDLRSGIYLGLSGGVAQTYGDSDFVHYAERFFLGGSSTLRGFDFRRVGPNEGDYAIGGETFVQSTIEYRYPLYSVPLPGTTKRREMFRLLLFVDSGILDPDPFALSVDELRASAGFGFGLAYPIPLTFNFGWPLRKGDGDVTEVFSFRLTLR